MDNIGKKCEYQLSLDMNRTIRVIATVKKTWKSDNKTLCSFEENDHAVNLDICKFIVEEEKEVVQEIPSQVETTETNT